MKTTKFPLTIKQDSVSARIYKSTSTKNGVDYTSYSVAYRLLGKRTVKQFADANAAIDHAKEACRKIADGDHATLQLKDADRHEYLRAKEILAPLGVHLDEVAREHADIHAILDGKTTPIEACRDWLKRHNIALPKISVADAAKQLEQQAETDGKSQRRREQIAAVLDRFAESFNVQVHTVAPKLVADYLTALPFKERTKRNHRDVLGYFSRWLVLRGYLPKGTDLLEGVQNYSARKVGEITTFSPEEIALLISRADERMLPFLVIGAFAGLRSAEIQRLDWQDIDLDEGFIEIKADKAKTNVRRIVPVKDNLKAWLLPIAKRTGKVLSANLDKEITKLAGAANIAWRKNALRHSYISARVAESGDVPRAADEAGNSVQVIRTNYLKRMRPNQAAAWFAIAPTTAANVVELKAATR